MYVDEDYYSAQALRIQNSMHQSASLFDYYQRVFSPTIIKPCQYETYQKIRQPEQSLLIAVLESAVISYREGLKYLKTYGRIPNKEAAAEYNEVKEWFNSSKINSGTIYTYNYICDTLGFDGKRLREKIENINEEISLDLAFGKIQHRRINDLI